MRGGGSQTWVTAEEVVAVREYVGLCVLKLGKVDLHVFRQNTSSRVILHSCIVTHMVIN